MTSLTPTECHEWLRSHGLSHLMPEGGEHHFPNLRSLGFQAFRCKLPKDSGKKVALARVLYRNFIAEPQVLVWIRNWDVWSSSGHVPLLSRLREALGSHQALDETPGHLFSNDEQLDAISVVVMSLQFFWDCLVIGASLEFAVLISHDEYYSLMSRDPLKLDEVRKMFETGDWGEPMGG